MINYGYKGGERVDTEAIKIALNSVYGKSAFNTDTDSVSEELRDIVRDARAMTQFLNEKRDEFNNLKVVNAEELLEEMRAREYDEEFEETAEYWNRIADKFEDLVEKIYKKNGGSAK